MGGQAPAETAAGRLRRGQPLTMMALTMSLWLSLRARTALALDTLACAITSSMSRSSSPASSTWSGICREVLERPPPPVRGPRQSCPPPQD